MPSPSAPEPPVPSSTDALVEEMGDYFDRMGSQRIAGRVVGWLLVAEPAHQSADEIRAAVKASKGSVSTVTRQLVDFGLVERIGLPGDRRTYYRLRADGWTAMMETKLRSVYAFRDLAERWRDRLADGPGAERIAAMADMYDFFAREMGQVVERWREQVEEADRRDR